MNTPRLCSGLMLMGLLFFGLSAGSPDSVFALSHADPESPVVSDSQSTTLVVQCGIPGEFDPSQPVSTLSSETSGTMSAPQEPLSSDSTSPTLVPEPATLVLVGLGVLGVLRFARHKRSRPDVT